MSTEPQEAFLNRLESEIADNKITLPTLPEVALRVRDAAANENTTSKQLADIVTTDTALSARILQIVNSPLYRSREKIDNIQVAIIRMGSKIVRDLVTSLVMQQMFQPTSDALDKHFRQTWDQSVTVSAMSRALASMCKRLNPDQAMLAGLIHQIGKLPILMMAESRPELANNDALLGQYLEELHPRVGKMIMDNWDFPEALSIVPWQYTDYTRNPSPEADYVDIVIVACLQNLSEKELTEKGIELSSVQAFSKLGLHPEVVVLEIEGISEEVEEAQRLMH